MTFTDSFTVLAWDMQLDWRWGVLSGCAAVLVASLILVPIREAVLKLFGLFAVGCVLATLYSTLWGASMTFGEGVFFSIPFFLAAMVLLTWDRPPQGL